MPTQEVNGKVLGTGDTTPRTPPRRTRRDTWVPPPTQVTTRRHRDMDRLGKWRQQGRALSSCGPVCEGRWSWGGSESGSREKKLGKKLGIPPGLCLLTPFQVPFPHGEEVAWKCWTATASSDMNSLMSRSYWQCHAADGAILSMEPGACDISLSRPQPHTATARACEETVACLALGTSLGTQKADQGWHA